MENIYDNGEICLGKVEKIRQYLIDNTEETWEIEDILDELKTLNNDDVVAINYDNGMGYSIDWWTKDDKVNYRKEVEK